MADSLLLDTLELLHDSAPDGPYALSDVPDLGAPVPDTTVIEGSLIDADVVTGSRSGNRTVALQIEVTGSDRADLSVNVNAVAEIVNRGTFTLTWTPDGGFSVIYDCFRGQFTRSRVLLEESQLTTTVTVVFLALPFGRSDVPETIAAASATFAVDGLNNGTGLTGATYQTTTKYEGTGSASVTLTRNGDAANGYTYSLAGGSSTTRPITAVDLSSYASIGFRFKWAAPSLPWPVTLHLTLSDGTHDRGVSAQVTVATGGTWYLATFPLTGFAPPIGTAVNLAAVTSWAIQVASDGKSVTPAPPSTSTCYIDDIRAVPSSAVAVTSGSGSVLTIPAVKGTARAPAALTVTGSGTLLNLLVHRPPIEQDPDLGIIHDLTAGSATLPAVNSTFDGTYAVALILNAVGTGARTVTVTITQLDPNGATLGSAAVLTTTWPSTLLRGKIRIVDLVTLPIVKVPDETACTYTVAVTVTGGSPDTLYAVAFLDTRGQTVICNDMLIGGAGTTTKIYIDTPEPATGVGQVYFTVTDRTAAHNLMELTTDNSRTRQVLDGGPMLFEPGDNRLLLASPNETPVAAISYFPCWLDERTA